MIKTTLIASICSLCLQSCKSDTPEAISGTINLFKQHSIKKEFLNWEEIEKTLNNSTTLTRQEKIHFLLSVVNDNHSSFFDAQTGLIQSQQHYLTEDQKKSWQPLQIQNCAYLLLQATTQNNSEYNRRYVKEIREKIRLQSKPGTHCWIIDLRQNSGGNFWPMFLALNPLLGDGEFGAFEHADGKINHWKLKQNKAWQENTPILQIENPEPPPEDIRKIFILTSPFTASAAEAIVIAFKLNPKTTVIGLPTYGATTGTIQITLPENHHVTIANSYMLDRNGKRQTGQIIPDILAGSQQVTDATIRSLINQKL